MNPLLLAYIIFSFVVFLFLIALDLSNSFRKKETTRLYGTYKPKTLVIVPCRGIDLTLERNLISIKGQRYRNFKVIAVVDGSRDAAIPIIKKAGVGYIVAGEPKGASSGKVNAILTAIKRFRDFDVYVIADSDIEVDRLWLESLIAPMAEKDVGSSTMFPYFNPLGGFWSKVKMVWGFVGESLLESESSRFGWGGTLAFKKELVDRWFIDLATKSRFAVSDDICVTMATKRKGMRMAYTNESQPRVNSNDNFRMFAEWANRQTAWALLGYRKNLYRGIIYYSSEIVLFVSGIVLSAFVSPIFLLYFLHLLRSYWKTFKRAGKAYWELLAIVPIMPFLYLSNLLIANSIGELTWRGRKYSISAARDS